jgi:hypothetical protein
MIYTLESVELRNCIKREPPKAPEYKIAAELLIKSTAEDAELYNVFGFWGNFLGRQTLQGSLGRTGSPLRRPTVEIHCFLDVFRDAQPFFTRRFSPA